MSSQTSLSTTTILLIIVTLVIGASGGYFVSSYSLQPRITELTLHVADLEHEVNNLTSSATSLGSLISTLTKEKSEFQQEISTLGRELDYFNQSYTSLQKTLNFHNLSNNSRELVITLNASTSGYEERTITFDAGYGILMDAFVSLSSSPYESKIDIELSWRRGERRGFLVGLGNAPAEGYDNVTVKTFCEIYDEGSNQIWIEVGAQIVELPWIEKSRVTTFSIP